MAEPEKVVCAECGGSDVEVVAWVNAQTNVFASDLTETPLWKLDEEDTWCNDCEDHTGLVKESEYEDDDEDPDDDEDDEEEDEG